MLLDQNIRREHQHRPHMRQRSLRHFVKLKREAHFDVNKLPHDLQRVFRHVEYGNFSASRILFIWIWPFLLVLAHDSSPYPRTVPCDIR